MIDTNARLKAAQVVRRFISGQIENFEFEEVMPNTDDDAINAIKDTLWCFYDDFHAHKLKDKWAPTEQFKKKMLRWVMFLHTAEQYSWPRIRFPGIRPVKHGFFSKLFNGPHREKLFLNSGEHEYWPFISSESFQQANNNPRLLAGFRQTP